MLTKVILGGEPCVWGIRPLLYLQYKSTHWLCWMKLSSLCQTQRFQFWILILDHPAYSSFPNYCKQHSSFRGVRSAGGNCLLLVSPQNTGFSHCPPHGSNWNRKLQSLPIYWVAARLSYTLVLNRISKTGPGNLVNYNNNSNDDPYVFTVSFPVLFLINGK